MKILLRALKKRKMFFLCSAAVLVAVLGLELIIGGLFHVVMATPALGTVPKGIPEQYYAGGRKGTVFNVTSSAYELPVPAINSDPVLSKKFLEGEALFDANFVVNPDVPFGGLGPVYNNISCRNCHPNYGRARRVDKFNSAPGNGYIVLVHTPEGKLVDGYKFMLQIYAVPPYTPVARGVKITWKNFVDEHGNRYPDGTPYNKGKPTEGTLVYPVADLIDPQIPLPENYKVSMEATIGLYGVGRLDSIRDEDIVAEYERQQASAGPVKGRLGRWITEPHDGKKHLAKFNWRCTRATLENGPCFNGMWSVYNLTREDKPALFASEEWIRRQEEMGLDADKLRERQPVELKKEDIESLLIWLRGLAVPAARNLDDPLVQQGEELFHEIGCAECHKPSWITGEDKYLPALSRQKIWPYTDLLMHYMGEINVGFSKYFRTPPLWGRGLMKVVAGHTDMFHDLRARDFEEAILWHFGEGLEARENFRKLSAEERAALIKFLEAI